MTTEATAESKLESKVVWKSIAPWLLVLLLMLAGGLIGHLSADWLAKTNDLVVLAERIWQEESQGLTEYTEQSQSYRALGMPLETIYNDAERLRNQFRIGAPIFGVWCGLILGVWLIAVLREQRTGEYEADSMFCLACARCFIYCPREQKRLNISCK